ncbi:Hypothetical protein GLP15_4898 [Giardia lamblia P15]|uniref:Uncharacterized protein n=1 Tax=Giardia intestinalis (strain P15) TaxID=658858 RepID=E1F9S1_GIAIA|nr:Hypothetical protein GLP15_4898 [Giardia lamblia P15]
MSAFTIGIVFLFLVTGEASKAKVSICDPSEILSIAQEQVFNRSLLTHAVMEAAGLPSDGDLLSAVNRSNYFKMSPCLRFLDLGSYAANVLVRNPGTSKCRSFSTMGIVGGFRSDYLFHYIKTMSPPDTSNTCVSDNTITFVLPRLTHASQMNRNLTIWTVVLLIILIVGTCWWMMAMDETKPDDLDDNFTDLLFNCPEMQLADESILDDEPWEDGGLDY